MFVSVEEDGGIQIASYRETKATVSIEGTWRDFPALQRHQTRGGAHQWRRENQR